MQAKGIKLSFCSKKQSKLTRQLPNMLCQLLPVGLLLLHLSPCVASRPQFTCSSTLDCNLNGDCREHACRCDYGWKGPDCGVLDFLPAMADVRGGAYGYSPNVTNGTWGGKPLLINGTYHLYVTEIADGSLSNWKRNSTVTHAVSSTPEGPYEKVSRVVPQEAHNPDPILLQDGRLAIFHLGSGTAPANFSQNITHISEDGNPDGPFKPVYLGLDCNNPAPWQHKNGTLYLACRNKTIFRGEIGGPWSQVAVLPPPMPGWGFEDPTLWIDYERDAWHLMSHAPNKTNGNIISSHFFSANGVNWTASQTQPYGNTALLSNGSYYHMNTRERPKLLFNEETGKPAYLFNGINANPYCPVSPLGCKVHPHTNWDYLFVQPIRQQ